MYKRQVYKRIYVIGGGARASYFNQMIANRTGKEVLTGSTEGTAVGNIVAVSYTHLRAHETVLDLVCRLLLEKKKKQSHNVHTPSIITYCQSPHQHHCPPYPHRYIQNKAMAQPE
ncbi:FGGY-family carbohydrate kinase [Streptococcus pneumoniae D39]|nr:FGGY-family carbohydrate kinase [Streptococcus pneumoniae D39]